MRSSDHRAGGALRAGVMLAALGGLSGAAADGPGKSALGELPAGAISGFEVSDVGVELCRRHFFSTSDTPVAMPVGYRLVKLSESRVPAEVALVRQRPDLGDYAKGTFCFVEAGVHKINGRDVHPGRRSRFLFTWVDIAPMEAGTGDRRYRGTPRRAQLFFIYDDRGVDRALARRVTPNAMFGRIDIERVGDRWRAGARTSDGFAAASVAPSGGRKPVVHELPAFETLPLTQAARDHFMVLTYAGHHEQKAAGTWRAGGKAAWARSLSGAVEPANATFIQDGFSVRFGLYKF